MKSLLHADINLYGDKTLGTRAEIKNLNSFSNFKKALEYETSQYIIFLLLNKPIIQSSKKWNEKLNNNKN